MNEFSLCSLTSYDIRTRSEDDLDRKLELRAKKDRAAFFFVLREAMMQTFTQWSKYVPKIRYDNGYAFENRYDGFAFSSLRSPKISVNFHENLAHRALFSNGREEP